MSFCIQSNNPNYLARIVKLPTVRKHSNADRLFVTTIDGNNIISGPGVEEGQIYIYCPLESCLNRDFLSYTNSFQDPELNKDKTVKGFFASNCRIRCIKLRGERSEGYIFSASSLVLWLESIGKKVDADDLVIGKDFDSFADILIVEKYVNKTELFKLNRENQAQKRKDKKKVRESKIIENQFRLSQDVVALGRYINNIQPQDLIACTVKYHGCLHYRQRIAMYDGSFKKIYDIQVGDIVLGEMNGYLVPSRVTNKFNNGPSNKWLRVYRGGAKWNGSVVCTENHEFYTSSGYIQAKDLRVGDDLLYTYKCFEPNTKQWEILAGLMLGDASLSVGKHSCFINVSHKMDHFEYLQYIKANLTNLIKPDVSYMVSGYGTKMVRIGTIVNDLITKYFLEMQLRGGKRLFPWIVDMVSPVSLAFWYMDDGCLAHSEYQRDRACFAICRYPDEDLYVLEGIFRKFNINPIFYKADGYNRLRLNHKDADKLFQLIQEYIPPCMQYKLPKEFRSGKNALTINADLAIERFFTKPIKVKLITDVTNSVEQSSRWDIETETHNFFTEGVLVHNSNFSAGRVLCKKPLKGYEKFLKFCGVNIVDSQYDLIWASRGVIKNAYADKVHNSFYDSDIWGIVADKLKNCILDGITVYGEIVGYTPRGSFIQKDYDYECDIGSLNYFIFRITYTSPSGKVFEFSWQQVKDYCTKYGINHVQELYYGFARDLFNIPINEEWHQNFLKHLSDKYLEKDCYMCKNKVPFEGVVIVPQNGNYCPYKHKSFRFKQRESLQLDSGEVDIETKESVTVDIGERQDMIISSLTPE